MLTTINFFATIAIKSDLSFEYTPKNSFGKRVKSRDKLRRLLIKDYQRLAGTYIHDSYKANFGLNHTASA